VAGRPYHLRFNQGSWPHITLSMLAYTHLAVTAEHGSGSGGRRSLLGTPGKR